MPDLNLMILTTRGWKLQNNKRQNVAHKACLLGVTDMMSMTSAVLGLMATSSNYPVILGFRVGTGPFREQGRSLQGSLNLQKGLAGYSWPSTYRAFHSFFPLLCKDSINSLGHVSPLILFVCFLVFHRNIDDKNGPF